MRIGLDFDNTIIAYDEVFLSAARARGLVADDFRGTKQAIRDRIRLLPDGELSWQRLQGHVYGKGIEGATMFEGVESFLRRAGTEGCSVLIVSHKTEYGHYDPDRINLREAARDWLIARGLLDGEYGIPASNVFFEATRAEKLTRIAALGCTHFVDDLEEVLLDPAFPSDVKRILLHDGEQPRSTVPYKACASWRDIEEQVFGRG